MLRHTALAVILLTASAGIALADPIEGRWRTESGQAASIERCGADYCVTLLTGAHAGRQIGRMSGADGRYAGTITDPAREKTYKGKATLSGGALKMSGCVLGGLICRSQTWSRL